MNRFSRVITQNRVSNLKMQAKQASFISIERDSSAFNFDENLDIEDEDSVPGISGMSVHRCSMIKKYNIETFFSPAAKMLHRRAATATQEVLITN